jgi:hypothetical protein
MVEIETLLARLQKRGCCDLAPPAGVPNVAPGHILPPDLVRFYKMCGGGRINIGASFGWCIVPPAEFVLANPFIRGAGLSTQELKALLPENDLSWSWYIVAEGFAGGDYITIDCHPDRAGICYDSFWETHAVPGHSAIIALSFTELMMRLIESEGDKHFWENEGVDGYGDAYGDSR